MCIRIRNFTMKFSEVVLDSCDFARLAFVDRIGQLTSEDFDDAVRGRDLLSGPWTLDVGFEQSSMPFDNLLFRACLSADVDEVFVAAGLSTDETLFTETTYCEIVYTFKEIAKARLSTQRFEETMATLHVPAGFTARPEDCMSRMNRDLRHGLCSHVFEEAVAQRQRIPEDDPRAKEYVDYPMEFNLLRFWLALAFSYKLEKNIHLLDKYSDRFIVSAITRTPSKRAARSFDVVVKYLRRKNEDIDKFISVIATAAMERNAMGLVAVLLERGYPSIDRKRLMDIAVTKRKWEGEIVRLLSRKR